MKQSAEMYAFSQLRYHKVQGFKFVSPPPNPQANPKSGILVKCDYSYSRFFVFFIK